MGETFTAMRVHTLGGISVHDFDGGRTIIYAADVPCYVTRDGERGLERVPAANGGPVHGVPLDLETARLVYRFFAAD
jgi:hypothetical protein